MRCASCDIEITDKPTIGSGQVFCCGGCAEGGPCVCSYEDQAGRRPRNGHGDPDLLWEMMRTPLEGNDRV
jgi:hypothetical protein